MISIFPLRTFHFSAAPAYGIEISQRMQYSGVCGSYHDFLDKGLLLTRKLLNQEFIVVMLKSSLRKFYGHPHDFVSGYGISVSHDHGYVPFVVIAIRFFPHS
jgi:hypothetical protein